VIEINKIFTKVRPNITSKTTCCPQHSVLFRVQPFEIIKRFLKHSPGNGPGTSPEKFVRFIENNEGIPQWTLRRSITLAGVLNWNSTTDYGDGSRLTTCRYAGTSRCFLLIYGFIDGLTFVLNVQNKIPKQNMCNRDGGNNP